MRIPGLTFIIVPILCWLLYINFDTIINSITNAYTKHTSQFFGVCALIFCISLLVEHIIRYESSHYNYNPSDMYVLKPITLLFRLGKYINNKLTVNI